jgi:hypothetical protein
VTTDIDRAAAKRSVSERERHTLLVDSLASWRWGWLVGLAAAACALAPGALFVWRGPSNTLVEAGVAAIFAALALVLAFTVPARVQDRLAAKKLAALARLPGFSVENYRELLSEPRAAGRLVVNARCAVAGRPSTLPGWHLEWDGNELLAETDELPGELALDSRFKSTGAPASVPTNAAFHAKLEQLLAAIGEVAAISVDIVS